MRDAEPLASIQYAPGRLDETLLFLKRTRDELRELRMVRVWTDRLAVYDVNHDAFEVLGLGYQDQDVVPVLDAINTAYNKDTIHNRAPGAYKEFKTGRRYPWARDRVM